jgi:radical SAM superfamily enzyme YgiQ (UPF0313 family)
MKVLLADPPIAEIGTEQADTSPNLGILYLISSLRESVEGVQIDYVDALRKIESHLAEVDRIRPDVYGISFASFYAPLAYKVINAIKEKYPSILVICGGAHPTALPDDVFEHSRADICALGEGEETLADLVRGYMSEEDFAHVAGIAYRVNGEVHRNALRPLLRDLDARPAPAWDLIDFSKYLGCRKYKGTPSTSVVASRGCPLDCVFCSNPVWKLQKPWVRLRSPESIAREVEYLYRRGIREVYLRSDEMNPNPRWCADVFRALADLGHSDLYFQCNLKATPIDDELAASLSLANCWVTHVGIESGNDRVLAGIRKKVAVTDTLEACRTLKRHNVKVFGFFMMYQVWEKDGELQVETPQEVDQTLAFLRRLRREKLVDYMSWSYATPFPGSDLYRIAKKHDLIKPSLKDGSEYGAAASIWEISMNLPGISERRMALSRAKGMLLQGLFVVQSEGFFRRKNFLANMKRAAKKLKLVLLRK